MKGFTSIRDSKAVAATAATAIMMGAGVFVGGQLVADVPAQAQDQSAGYYGRECTVKALSGEGLMGGGCNSYGVAHWIPGNSGSPEIASWIQACVRGGAWAVAVVPFAKVSPQGLIASTFLGCATSAADDLLTN
ncbi:hypothetical protein [Rhodococcus sp. 14-2470-1b]|uniref:hypothetical protein n=1 Tax=Rhodococcus sp. 14-2470-1b TaxID=2023149 RepID=UPI0011402252|nr:hypothetical protein [Rhodococcus sp. 14-2470-1b]